MSNLTMGSLFDGSGGFPFGAMLEGITPVWASEIEPFAIRVTTKRLPSVKHLGDINKINGANIEPVDIITFGSPCTNMSVAGKREGLHGKESVLFYQAIRIIKEMRHTTNGKYPRFICWENVPGCYSSAKGEDFRQVLKEIAGIAKSNTRNETETGDGEAVFIPMPEKNRWLNAGEIMGNGFSIAWRTLDAQYFGVPQRRRRCYLIADFDGECAGKILFESESLSGHPPQGASPREGTARHAEGSAGAASRVVLNDQGGSVMDISKDITGTLRAQEHGHQPIVFEPGAVSRIGSHVWDDFTGTLRADMGDNRLSVAIPINTQIATRHKALGEGTGFGVGEDGDPAFTLQVAHSHAVAVSNNNNIKNKLKNSTENNNSNSNEFSAGFMGGQGSKAGGIGYSENVSPTLKSEAGGNSVPCVMAPDCSEAFSVENHPTDGRVKLDESGKVQTLTGRMGTGGNNVPLVMNELQYALTVGEDVANTLTSTDYKGTQCVFEPRPAPQTLKIRSGCEGGGKGALVQDNLSATLSCNNDQTVFVPFRKGTRPHNKDEGQKWEEAETANTLNTFDTGETRCSELAVKVYGICSDASNSMRSDNPNSGVYEAETSRTLDGNGGSPSCNQGGMAVVCLEGNGTRPSHRGDGIGKDIAFTLNTVERHAVAYDCRNHAASEVSGTIQAKNNGGQSLNYVNPVAQPETKYAVRRLTPGECALLQGFPSDWCGNLGTPNPSEADIDWWAEVFETYRLIMGTSGKPKSRSQIIKWLKNPHSDSAEYRLWGNGVALPCVRFVMAGIAWAAGLGMDG